MGLSIDREKVIRGTEICLTGGLPQRCTECPYHNNGCDRQRMIDTLELLKEQETKIGKWILDDEDANSWECSECGGLLMINDGTPHENDWHFCPYCGSKLEEEENIQAQREYEAAIELQQYCERYEPTYNPEDGSM